MSNNWKAVAGVIAAGAKESNPHSTELEQVLFEGYSAEEIDKAMRIFDYYATALSISPHMGPMLVGTMYVMAARQVDRLEQQAQSNQVISGENGERSHPEL